MPEGDTLRRAEAALSPVLDGQVAQRLWFKKIRGHRPRVGQTIERVDAVGKYLLIHFDRGLTLRTHLGMAGTWRTIPPDREPPRDPRLRIVIGTNAGTALCFAAPTIDTFLRNAATTPMDGLGPDLSDEGADIDLILRRARELSADKTLAEMLLDQRVAAGAGNVFKSEVAYLARTHPFTKIELIPDDALSRIWRIGHQQLLDNRDRNRRKTTSRMVSGDTYVYGRFRKPCRRCSDSILYSAAGVVTERSTYWCPRCQPKDRYVPTAN